MQDLTKTKVFSSEDMRREMIRQNLKTVIDALNERGYNAVHQIAGYLISNDPAYISSHKNARNYWRISQIIFGEVGWNGY